MLAAVHTIMEYESGLFSDGGFLYDGQKIS